MPRRGPQFNRASKLTRPDIPAAEVAARYRAGETLIQLAVAYGCAAMTIRQRLEAEGEPVRTRGYRSRPSGSGAETNHARRSATAPPTEI